ncbi:hypothetical protein Nepgr_012273 [Nepenthes gracilis]|uniref:DUF3741 domain-containing protein n=1 Tax=Nepenthes gracilis TaxID=150966 RepID=A0AAD3SFU5_NEPGR|nr:hypothetical protein Nepgr_012273 [Nepenthes gracilis]
MAAEKKGSKGNFLYLFDWNTKSRKKLFSNKSEELNQGKEVVDNVAISPFRLREVHANGVGSIVKGSDNYSSGSSVGGDDGYGTRAPGVVARLMGLESLPTSFSCEPNSASFHEPHSLGNHYARSGFGFLREPHILDYSCMPDKLEGFPWNSSDSRLNKGHGRPIERFQTEVLPLKSAKPISITNHKLLSPVKSPGFVPTNDAAYIMEGSCKDS